MCSYLLADLKRLVRRFPRWVLLFIILGGMSVVVAVVGQLGIYGRWSSYTFVTAVCAMIKPLSLIIGVIELIFIFGDDIKARTIQASIGTGLSRTGLVLSKLIEIMILALLDVIIYAVFIVLMGLLFKAPLSTAQLSELSVYFFMEWVRVIAFTCITMILLFFKRSLIMGVIMYIMLLAKIIDKLIGILLSIGPLENLHADRYTMSKGLDTLQTFLIGGAFGWRPLLMVLAYIAAASFITVLIFRKRELEF